MAVKSRSHRRFRWLICPHPFRSITRVAYKRLDVGYGLVGCLQYWILRNVAAGLRHLLISRSLQWPPGNNGWPVGKPTHHRQARTSRLSSMKFSCVLTRALANLKSLAAQFFLTAPIAAALRALEAVVDVGFTQLYTLAQTDALTKIISTYSLDLRVRPHRPDPNPVGPRADSDRRCLLYLAMRPCADCFCSRL